MCFFVVVVVVVVVANLSRGFPVFAVANTGSCVRSQNKIGHPTHRYRQLMQVPVLSAWNINRFRDMCHCFSGFVFRNCRYGFVFPGESAVFNKLLSVLCC